MNNINKIIVAIIAIVLAFAGYSYFNQPANIKVVGVVVSADDLASRYTLVEIDGRLTMSLCSEQKLATLKAASASYCVLSGNVERDVLVKAVKPAYEARIKAATNHSMYSFSGGLAVSDGWVTE